jgi:hypothetical protein
MGLRISDLVISQSRTSHVRPYGAGISDFAVSDFSCQAPWGLSVPLPNFATSTSVPNPMALDLFALLNLPTSATNGYCTIDSGATITIPHILTRHNSHVYIKQSG